jgi:hypothetical protein
MIPKASIWSHTMVRHKEQKRTSGVRGYGLDRTGSESRQVVDNSECGNEPSYSIKRG